MLRLDDDRVKDANHQERGKANDNSRKVHNSQLFGQRYNKLAKMQVAHGVERAMATYLHADLP